LKNSEELSGQMILNENSRSTYNNLKKNDEVVECIQEILKENRLQFVLSKNCEFYKGFDSRKEDPAIDIKEQKVLKFRLLEYVKEYNQFVIKVVSLDCEEETLRSCIGNEITALIIIKIMIFTEKSICINNERVLCQDLSEIHSRRRIDSILFSEKKEVDWSYYLPVRELKRIRCDKWTRKVWYMFLILEVEFDDYETKDLKSNGHIYIRRVA
jgi:hypothetical protein